MISNTHPYLDLAIHVVFIATIVTATANLPNVITDVLGMPIVQILVVGGALFHTTRDPATSVIGGIAFSMIFYILSNYVEGFTLIQQKSDVIPGCVNTKVSDLLDLFNGDINALKQAMYVAQVPLDIQLNDENAPMIATYLVNTGKIVSQTCAPPQ